EEMRGFVFESSGDNTDVRDHLASRIGGFGVGAGEISENWLPLFQDAFAQPGGTAVDLITYENIARAIGEYENSQVFIDNPWSRFVGGDQDAISEAAKRGALLFYRDLDVGGLGCVQCHSGDFFTDEGFHAAGFPQIGRGKGDIGSLGDTHGDRGRERVTGLSSDRFSFRTPSLLNVEVTGPWGHAGAFLTLEETVRYHLDPDTGWTYFNFAALPPGTQTEGCFENTGDALLTVTSRRLAGTSPLPLFSGVADAQIQDMVAFLKSLTDPRVLDPAALEPWIARNDGTFTDSQLLQAHDGDANSL
ncbi:MAG: cytochrome-c peroxidase, partial [Planctomycetota bacterium]